MNIDVPMPFNCPHCGAPGYVTSAGTQYNCMCRQGTYGTYRYIPSPEPGCQPLKPLTEADVRRIIREELGKRESQS